MVELMITVAVVAVLAGIAFPSFQGVIRSNRLATSSNEFLATLSLARSEAIRNSRGAGICPSTNGTACGGTWNNGWMVWADANANGAFDAGETVLRYTQGNPALIATASASSMVLDNRGRMSGRDADAAVVTGAQTLTLASKECPRGQQYVRIVNISATGQARTTRGACQ